MRSSERKLLAANEIEWQELERLWQLREQIKALRAIYRREYNAIMKRLLDGALIAESGTPRRANVREFPRSTSSREHNVRPEHGLTSPALPPPPHR